MPSKDDIVAFLGIFYTVNRAQRLGIIKHLTSQQCQILREAVYNLLFNSSIQIIDKDRQYFNRRMTVLRMLASKRVCVKEKRNLLVANQALLQKVVSIVINYLDKKEV